jgi:hypothetical protein
MKMGKTGLPDLQQPGQQYASFDELPAAVKAYTKKNHPLRHCAGRFYQPNETS